jgi:GNAT superfamily N-acetyltransferase
VTTPTIRPFTAADLDAVLRIATEGDADDVVPAYLEHVARVGSLRVVEGAGGRTVAFGGVVDVHTLDGPAAMVTDLFVEPSARGAGVGTVLLGHLLDGRRARMTCSSAHPAALPMYRAAGMTPVGRLLYLAGHGRAQGGAVSDTMVTVRRVRATHPREAASLVGRVLDRISVSTRVELHVPEWQPLAEWLTAQGFVEFDRDVVCTTPGLRLDPATVVVSPGLW